ncbi:MAG: M18 family aminopeptidase [Lachnospiraceae bacterium]|nr:M18 family aminopeptidase [Lachnospiraceae bacterium]
MRYSDRLIEFTDKAVSPFHAVEETVKELKEAGFNELDPGESWALKKGGKYYVSHHGSTLFAFTLGTKDPLKDDLRIATAHTDFPCLRIKTSPDINSSGYASVNTEIYGGAILNTWLDRPLSVSGRIALKSDDIRHPEMKLIDLKRPVLTIPNVAIHINRDVNKGFELDQQKDMLPMAGILPSFLKKDAKKDDCSGEKKLTDEDRDYFINFIAKEAGVNKEDILSFELCVYNCEKGCYVGVANDFISAPRLDNMTSVFADLTGITEGKRATGINVMAIFDHEEIGSRTKQGAGSMVLSNLILKIYSSLTAGKKTGPAGEELFLNKLSDALLLSVDVGHAYHPYMGDKYDPVNKSLLNSGVVIKETAEQKYATDSEAIAVIIQMLKKNDIPYSVFVNRSGKPSGSTLGSIASSYLPVMTIDTGVPLLAMHSARELMGAADEDALCDLLRVFYSI